MKKNKHMKHTHTLTNYNSNIDNNESETNGVTYWSKKKSRERSKLKDVTRSIKTNETHMKCVCVYY